MESLRKKKKINIKSIIINRTRGRKKSSGVLHRVWGGGIIKYTNYKAMLDKKKKL